MRKPLVIEGHLRNWGDGHEWDSLYVDDMALDKILPTATQRCHTTGPWADIYDLDNWLTMSDEEYEALDAACDGRWADESPGAEATRQRAVAFSWILFADYGRVKITFEWLDNDSSEQH